jgi:hypothetical protein
MCKKKCGGFSKWTFIFVQKNVQDIKVENEKYQFLVLLPL